MDHQSRQRSMLLMPSGSAMTASPDQEERARALIEQIQAGDEAAFETLFRIYYEALNDFVRRKVDRPEVAEELVQNVFLNLWRRRRAWQPRHSIKAYLYGAAVALDAINTVRDRAGLAPLAGLSQAELRAAIKQERIWELIGEGNHRKLDLLRWGTLGEALQERLAQEQQAPNTNESLLQNIQITADNFEPHMTVGPIPTSEILLNPNLTQNEGY